MKNKTEQAEPQVDRRFLNIIQQHKAGAAISDLSAALKQVTSAVQLTGKTGKVTLEMTVTPATKGDPGTLVFLTKVKAKAPETEAPGSIFYADEDFNLVREDPKQARLPLKELETPVTAPLREVSEVR